MLSRPLWQQRLCLTLDHHAPLTARQVEKIIQFYTMDQEKRNALFSEITVDVLRSALPIEKKSEACAFLAEAVQVPRELQVAI